MPVIINDFEIAIEPKPSMRDTQSDAQGQKRSADTQSLQPDDIEQIIHRLAQRRERLHAD